MQEWHHPLVIARGRSPRGNLGGNLGMGMDYSQNTLCQKDGSIDFIVVSNIYKQGFVVFNEFENYPAVIFYTKAS